MKPFHHILISALKNALIVVIAFGLFKIIEDMRIEWKTLYPETVAYHAHFSTFLHLASIFIADFALGITIYYALKVVV
jgi:hypothetical protein